ncbi:hypothetical protein PG994_004923 [Apiospora phragmitis]|uniref:Tetratricopeptide repeat protein n=1 Tax=Apiospora phragmitis TaxID=2905665 RepID=A0ABR1VRY8_9PEZI
MTFMQELLAPPLVEFYSKEGAWLGDKQSLGPQIRDITGVSASALYGAPLSDFPISEREAWLRNRQTKYPEDLAYALLGIFGVHMPLIYGEGRDNAQKRLREEIQKAMKGTRADDFSVTFSLSDVPETQHFVGREGKLAEMRTNLNSDGSRRAVVLYGLGGIGRTQLAVTYAKRYRDEYSATFWFNIKDEASIKQSFVKGRMDEAETIYQRALQGYEKAWGADHTSTLSTVNNLGNLYSAQGRIDEAETMYQRALQGYEKALVKMGENERSER